MSRPAIAEQFERAFGRQHEALYSAPGRVNLIGEHTDYNGGLAFPFAIDRRTHVAFARRDDDTIRVHSSFEGETIETSLAVVLGDAPLHGWGAYVLGVARILGQEVGADVLGGFDLSVDSDIPVGMGVSSSHALECATATALVDAFELPISREQLIPLTQRVEHEVVGSPTGTLDQSAILLSEPDHGVLLDFSANPAPPQAIPLGFADAGLGVLIVDSDERHNHATGGYRVRKAECEQAAAKLGVTHLAELSLDQLEAARDQLTDVEFRRARHVITETARVRQFAELVAAGRASELGPLLTASHHSQRDDYECSTAAIDAAVAAALDAGALGARLTGGGFGGSSLALVALDEADRIAAEIAQQVAAWGHPTPTIYGVVSADGAHRDS